MGGGNLPYYGYKPAASYLANAPPIAPPNVIYNHEIISNYPLKFKVTQENTMWLVGGLAAAFLFNKFLKLGIFSKVGYYAGLAAAGLAVTDFIGIFSISQAKSIVPF